MISFQSEIPRDRRHYQRAHRLQNHCNRGGVKAAFFVERRFYVFKVLLYEGKADILFIYLLFVARYLFFHYEYIFYDKKTGVSRSAPRVPVFFRFVIVCYSFIATS